MAQWIKGCPLLWGHKLAGLALDAAVIHALGLQEMFEEKGMFEVKGSTVQPLAVSWACGTGQWGVQETERARACMFLCIGDICLCEAAGRGLHNPAEELRVMTVAYKVMNYVLVCQLALGVCTGSECAASILCSCASLSQTVCADGRA